MAYVLILMPRLGKGAAAFVAKSRWVANLLLAKVLYAAVLELLSVSF